MFPPIPLYLCRGIPYSPTIITYRNITLLFVLWMPVIAIVKGFNYIYVNLASLIVRHDIMPYCWSLGKASCFSEFELFSFLNSSYLRLSTPLHQFNLVQPGSTQFKFDLTGLITILKKTNYYKWSYNDALTLFKSKFSHRLFIICFDALYPICEISAVELEQNQTKSNPHRVPQSQQSGTAVIKNFLWLFNCTVHVLYSKSNFIWV